MKDFKGFKERNVLLDSYTPVHNMFFDEVLAELNSMSEAKVLLAIYRNTFGVIEDINEKGEQVFRETYFVTTRKLAENTGLTQQSVIKGINKLIEKGFIEKIKEGSKQGYKLKLKKFTENLR